MPYKTILMLLSLLGFSLLTVIPNNTVLAQQEPGNFPKHRSRPHPPKEAFDACIDVDAGGNCSFETPHGILSGICLTKHDGFICVPDNHPSLPRPNDENTL